MSSILSTLMNKSGVTSTQVEETKTQLTTDTTVELEGVNAPEFEVFDDFGNLPSATLETSTDTDMDEIFASQPVNEKTPIDDLFSTTEPTAEAVAEPTAEVVAEPTTEVVAEPTTEVVAEPTAEVVAEPTTEVVAEPTTEVVAEPTTEVVAEPTVGNEDEIFTQTTNENENETNENTEMTDTTNLPWNLKPLNDRYFGFGGRTVNSLTRAGYSTLNDIKGMAYSELLEIRGFGRNCLTEVQEFLEAEGQSDWLQKRKSRNSTIDQSVSEDSDSVDFSDILPNEDSTEAVAEPVVEAVAEPVVEAVAEPVVEAVAEPVVEAVAEPVVEPTTSEASNTKVEKSNSRLKVLVVGNASSSMNGVDVKIASFEAVYAPAIRQICEQANAPSLAMVEYGKGWSALSATIRNNGWPQGVDILCVSKSFLSRSEVLMELRLLADVIVEG